MLILRLNKRKGNERMIDAKTQIFVNVSDVAKLESYRLIRKEYKAMQVGALLQ